MRVSDEQVRSLAEMLHELALRWARDHSATPEGGCLGGDECRWTATQLIPFLEGLEE